MSTGHVVAFEQQNSDFKYKNQKINNNKKKFYIYMYMCVCVVLGYFQYLWTKVTEPLYIIRFIFENG